MCTHCQVNDATYDCVQSFVANTGRFGSVGDDLDISKDKRGGSCRKVTFSYDSSCPIALHFVPLPGLLCGLLPCDLDYCCYHSPPHILWPQDATDEYIWHLVIRYTKYTWMKLTIADDDAFKLASAVLTTRAPIFGKRKKCTFSWFENVKNFIVTPVSSPTSLFWTWLSWWYCCSPEKLVQIQNCCPWKIIQIITCWISMFFLTAVSRFCTTFTPPWLSTKLVTRPPWRGKMTFSKI